MTTSTEASTVRESEGDPEVLVLEDSMSTLSLPSPPSPDNPTKVEATESMSISFSSTSSSLSLTTSQSLLPQTAMTFFQRLTLFGFRQSTSDSSQSVSTSSLSPHIAALGRRTLSNNENPKQKKRLSSTNAHCRLHHSHRHHHHYHHPNKQTASSNVLNFFGLTGSKYRHRILSKHDLDSFGRKDLTRLYTNLSLENAILVDDKETISRGQERNLLKIHPGLGSIPPQSPSEESFKVNHNLARALGLILLSLSHFEEKQKPKVESEKRQGLVRSSGTDGNECVTSEAAGTVPVVTGCVHNTDCERIESESENEIDNDTWTFQDSFDFVMQHHRESRYCYEIGWKELTKFSTISL
jgi:hypothetical protein